MVRIDSHKSFCCRRSFADWRGSTTGASSPRPFTTRSESTSRNRSRVPPIRTPVVIHTKTQQARTHTHAHTHAHTHTQRGKDFWFLSHAHIHTQTCFHSHTRIHTRARTHTRTHTHTHTHTQEAVILIIVRSTCPWRSRVSSPLGWRFQERSQPATFTSFQGQPHAHTKYASVDWSGVQGSPFCAWRWIQRMT